MVRNPIRTFIPSLQKLQTQLGIKDGPFADLLGVARSTVRDWYAEINNPKKETIEFVLNNLVKRSQVFENNSAAVLHFVAENTPGEPD